MNTIHIKDRDSHGHLDVGADFMIANNDCLKVLTIDLGSKKAHLENLLHRISGSQIAQVKLTVRELTIEELHVNKDYNPKYKASNLPTEAIKLGGVAFKRIHYIPKTANKDFCVVYGFIGKNQLNKDKECLIYVTHYAPMVII